MAIKLTAPTEGYRTSAITATSPIQFLTLTRIVIEMPDTVRPMVSQQSRTNQAS